MSGESNPSAWLEELLQPENKKSECKRHAGVYAKYVTNDPWVVCVSKPSGPLLDRTALIVLSPIFIEMPETLELYRCLHVSFNWPLSGISANFPNCPTCGIYYSKWFLYGKKLYLTHTWYKKLELSDL